MLDESSFVLDACVLAPARLCDVLLRLAEEPSLYAPKWSEEVLEEVRRTQTNKLGWPPPLAESWHNALVRHFPEAFVTGYAHLVSQCANHPKDRHVLAAAIHSGAKTIVTLNLRDFSSAACEPWGISAVSPDEFLCSLFDARTDAFVEKLEEIGRTRGCGCRDVLERLGQAAPRFSAYAAARLGF